VVANSLTVRLPKVSSVPSHENKHYGAVSPQVAKPDRIMRHPGVLKDNIGEISRQILSLWRAAFEHY
jgi:hypothetical protein